MIDFKTDGPNILLINTRLSESEIRTFNELKVEFDSAINSKGYFLIASSGSSQVADSSVKLVALSKQAVLNSAVRFNGFFNAGSGDNWGLMLPRFHVAGLSILARSHLAGSEVFEKEWNPETIFSWIDHNNIKFLSMVPTQVFDLVRSVIKAPAGLKRVFVGAGALDQELKKKAVALNWPLIETYGMTETASMIAVKENAFFKLLPGVEVKIESEKLSLRCNSILKATIQKFNDQIILRKFDESQWYQTDDLGELVRYENVTGLKFLGRSGDYVKILGEGVSLVELRIQFSRKALAAGYDISRFELVALEDERAGFRIILVTDRTEGQLQAEKLAEIFNLGCRPYEKILKCVVVGQIPRTQLGKLKTEDLKRIINDTLIKGTHG